MAENEQDCDADSFAFLRETLDASASERARFQAQLQNIPHTLQLHRLEEIRPSRLKLTQQNLESALCVGFDTDLETARAQNLLAYLLFRQHRPNDALQLLEQVLNTDGQSENLVTIANKAVILYFQHRISDAQALIERLHQIKTTHESDYSSLVLKATAELAFSYTRFGPTCYPYAVELYEKVLLEAGDGPDKCLWKFGLGLTRRRLLRLNPAVIFNALGPSEEEEEVLNCLSLFLDIIRDSDSDNLIAQAYSEIALILNIVHSTKPNYWKFCTYCGMNVHKACQLALHYNENNHCDNSVLVTCGRIYRYLKKPSESLDLLEKAISIRKTTTCFHHLGITYKYLATRAKYDEESQIKGCAQAMKQQHLRPVGEYSHGKCIPNRDIASLQKIIKSPPNNVTRFSIEDKYVKEAIHNFEQAFEISHGEHKSALYDLALIQKASGQLSEAKRNLLKVFDHVEDVPATLQINAYEQVGFVTKEMSESERDPEEKRKLEIDSSHHFHMALRTAAKLFKKRPSGEEYVRGLWYSFSCLLEEIDRSGHNKQGKLQEKAKLFHLIKDNKQSIKLLDEIRKMDPSQDTNPEHLKLCIESHVETQQYVEALAFVELLECTDQSEQTMRLFEEEHYVQKIHLRVAQEILLRDSLNPEVKVHLREVFKDLLVASQTDTFSSEETDASEDSAPAKGVYDVVILFEDSKSMDSTAKAWELTRIMEDVYGLVVAMPARDVLGNKLALEGEMDLVKHSTLVVVVAGQENISAQLRFLIDFAVKKGPRFVTTMLAEGNHVPEMLKTHRFTEEAPMSGDVDSVFRFFCFLVNIDMADF